MEQKKYTRFEKARIIGARALQISMGAPILLAVPSGVYDPLEIAISEYEKELIPITVKREETGSKEFQRYILLPDPIKKELSKYGKHIDMRVFSEEPEKSGAVTVQHYKCGMRNVESEFGSMRKARGTRHEARGY